MIYRITNLLLILSLGGLLAACQAIAPATMEPVPFASGEPAEKLDVQSLKLNELDTTFLAAIEAELKATEAAPNARMYISLMSDDGVEWQGELHRSDTHDTYWLQQAEASGLEAVQIEARTGTPIEAILASLPEPEPAGTPADVQVEQVRAELHDNGTWSFDVTVRHPDMGWEDYADGWQMETAESEILGLRILLHPHTTEQPFTRSIQGVEIPTGISPVYVRPHDLVSGYGRSIEVPIDTASGGANYEVVR